MVRLPVRFLLVLSAAALARGAFGQVVSSPDEVLGTGSIGVRLSGTLGYRDAGAGARGPVSPAPLVVPLLRAPLAEYLSLPPLQSQEPLFSLLRLARQGKTHFVLDQSRPDLGLYDVLYIDRNRNLDFTDDGPALQGKNVHVESRDLDYTEFTNVALDLYYGKDVSERYQFTLYAWYPRGAALEQLLMISSSWREGEIEIEGAPMRLAVFDDDCDGNYGVEGCSWALAKADADPAALLLEGARVPASVPLRVNGVPYRLAAVMQEGRLFELESETEAKARSAERDLDPTLNEPPRPRSAAQVAWGADLDSALEQARAGGKPVFLLFTVDWARGARLFESRTLGDREVVELLAHYACVQVNPDRAPDLKSRYAVQACPTSLILDAQGRVLETLVGYREARILAERLKARR
ncbi:MAG: thioredoxin family protein [Planctomycetes bacterium]|nr:thioredoxin family protein [Planctomycetota bacterium]